MEELRRRFDFDNNTVRILTVNGVYRQILEKKSSADLKQINSSTPEITELQLLWDKCLDTNPTVCSACCDALLALVSNGHAEFSYILNGLLNIVPSTKCLAVLVRALSDLLLMELSVTLQSMSVDVCSYQPSYSLRSPTHPFISVLTSSPNSWCHLIDHTCYILNHGSSRYGSCVVKLLEPFLKYVLLDPNPSTFHGPMRTMLCSVLLQFCATNVERRAKCSECVNYLVDFMVSIIPCLQVEPITNLSETNRYLQSLTNFILLHPQLFESHLTTLILNILCIMKTLLETGGELSQMLLLMQRIAESILVVNETTFIMISVLLMKMPTNYVKEMLTIAKNVQAKSLHSSTSKAMILPLLQIISISQTSIVMDTKQKQILQTLATELLLQIDHNTMKHGITPASISLELPCLDPWFRRMQTCATYANQFQEDSDLAADWLTAIQSELKKGDKVPDDVIILLVCLLTNTGLGLVDRCLEILTDIANKDVTKAPYFLSFLLYILSRVENSEIKLKLLYAMPELGTHKVCVGPVLKTLQTLAALPSMQHIGIRLVTSLWKLQDRCFPHLQKLLAIPNNKSTSSGDIDIVLLSKATSVRDICTVRPFQHGADMLSTVSWFLNECSADHEESIAALALDSLHALCKSEVVDIRTTWNALSRKLNKDKRKVVNRKVCKLFSLVPVLNVETDEYEEFRDDIVTILWSYAKSYDPSISGAAYKALANFDEQEFRLDDLPENLSKEVKLRIKANRREYEDDRDEEEELEDLDIPGESYVKLMCQVHRDILKNFEMFLTSLVAQEIKAMPRGIHHSAMKGQNKAANQNRAVISIPSLMEKQYEKNRLPSLKQGLAAALLLCYDPTLDVGRDGKPARRHLVSFGRSYQQMLNVLLNEVPVQPAEWLRTMLMPQTWTSFMHGLFAAMLEGRRAELEMQQSHKHTEYSEEDLKIKQTTIWLWVRDKITDQLKSSAKGNPTTQSNSVMALAGLAVVMAKHAASIGQSETDAAHKLAPEHTNQSQWLAMVTDTLITVLDGNVAPKGRVFIMCQQRSSRNTMTSSLLARAGAAVALSQIAPWLVTMDTERVYQMMDVLSAGLPGQSSADDSPVFQFHCGLGLGMLLSQLNAEHFSEVTGNEGTMATMKALDNLEKCSLDAGMENVNGCRLGLGLALSSMCGLGNIENRVHVTSIHSKLLAALDGLDDTQKSGTTLQMLCMSLACLTASAYSSGFVSSDVSIVVLEKITAYCKEYPQVPGLKFALGVLCNGLSVAGHGGSNDIINKIFTEWMERISKQHECPSLEQSAILSGLASLVSMDTTFIRTDGELTMTPETQIRQNQLVKLLTQTLTFNEDITIRNTSAWSLAYLYTTITSCHQTNVSLPSNYSYLPDTSLLRAIVDFLITAGKQGPEIVSPDLVRVAIAAVVNNSKVNLPPVNWAAILSALSKMEFGAQVHCLCLQLAICQCQSSPSASLFLQSWLSPALFHSLQIDCQKLMFSSLHVLLKAIPILKMKTFMESVLPQPFSISTADNTALCSSILEGLLEALKLPDPPPGATMSLHQSVENIYTSMSNTIQNHHIPLLWLLSECLCLLPSDLMDQITSPAKKGNLLKATFVRCYICGKGKQAITWLNPCIDATIGTEELGHHLHVIWLLGASLLQLVSYPSEQSMQWLLELMGHAKNVAYEKVTDVKVTNHRMATQFMMYAFTTAVVVWSTKELVLSTGFTSCLRGLASSYERDAASSLSSVPSTNAPVHMFIGNEKYKELILSQMSVHLPLAICSLLLKQPWAELTEKVLDWLIAMYEAPIGNMTDTCRNMLKESMYALRHFPEARKISYWTRLYKT